MGVEPIEGVDDLGNLVAGAATQAVGLAGEADERRFDPKAEIRALSAPKCECETQF